VLHSNGDVGMPGKPTEAEATYYPGNNHGSLVELSDGRVFVFGHRHTHGHQNSRQGVAEKVVIREDGFVEQAEMTSCGLNGGPLLATRETPAYTRCHLRSVEGILHYSSSVTWNEAHPYVAQEADAGAATSAYAYVHNLRDGAEVGWKYLAFDGSERSVRLEVRGTFNGSISVRVDASDGPEIACVCVSPSDAWVWAKASVSSTCTDAHAVYVVARGSGSLDLRALAFA
jgi:hypothetical protein